MARIKNMGTATMKFKEGIIVDGNAGNTTDSLIVSGTTVFKDHAQMEVNKRMYFDGSSIANGPYIYGNTTAIFVDGDDRVTLSMDKDFRVLDEDNNAIIHITDKDATDNDVYKEFDDVNIFFSGSVGSIGGSTFGASAFGGDLVVSGNMRLSETVDLGLSGSNIFGIEAENEIHVAAGGVLSYKVKNDGNVEFETAVTSSHFKVEGAGGQFVAFNEDTVKLKHVNWYSSNDRQYGQGQLWYQQWFGAVEPSDAGAQGGRRIGFFFHKPNKGASDADGGSGAHPTNTHMYLDLNGMYLQTGSFDIENGDIVVSGSIKGTDLGAQNEIVIVGTDNSLASSNLLTIDSVNERIGIGTTSPTVKLDMVGEASGETQIRMAQHHNGSDGPDIRFFTSRGTAAAPSAVNDADNIGRVNSFAYNGTSYVQAGTFGWDADGTDGDSEFNIRTRVGGTTADRFVIDNAGNVSIPGDLYFEDFVIADLSIPGLDLQTDTNAFRFNCPYNLTVEGLQLYLDQHTTSGNVTVTVTNTTDSNQMISLSITGTNTSASTTTVSNQNCDSGDVVTFAITATPANAQGLRANLQFRRRG